MSEKPRKLNQVQTSKTYFIAAMSMVAPARPKGQIVPPPAIHSLPGAFRAPQLPLQYGPLPMALLTPYPKSTMVPVADVPLPLPPPTRPKPSCRPDIEVNFDTRSDCDSDMDDNDDMDMEAMELDPDFISDKDGDDQWATLLQIWDDEKTWKLTTELAHPESSCHDGDLVSEPESEWEEWKVDDPVHQAATGHAGSHDDNEDLIKKTREVLERHCSRRLGESESSQHKTHAPLDGKTEPMMVDVQELRYSQLTCKETFACGRPLSQLVQDLLRGNVSLNDPFLQLTVYEATDEETNKPILKCVDNRRLWALKDYAKKCGHRVRVKVTFFSRNLLNEAARIWRNSDITPGKDVRLRKGGNNSRGNSMKSNRQPQNRNVKTRRGGRRRRWR